MFVLASGRKEIPAEFLTVFLGPGRKTPRIEGQWDLDEKQGVLILTVASAKGMQGKKEVKLKISPAGLIRANIGKEQYNIFPTKP